jgi:hypothetical protein
MLNYGDDYDGGYDDEDASTWCQNIPSYSGCHEKYGVEDLNWSSDNEQTVTINEKGSSATTTAPSADKATMLSILTKSSFLALKEKRFILETALGCSNDLELDADTDAKAIVLAKLLRESFKVRSIKKINAPETALDLVKIYECLVHNVKTGERSKRRHIISEVGKQTWSDEVYVCDLLMPLSTLLS